MSYQRSTGCPGLPGGLWWLLALSGLALLFYFMLASRQGPIESSLESSVNAALAEQGIGWAEASLDSRGRDVLLTGAAPSETARSEALQLAKGIAGVRIVDSGIDIVEPVVAEAVDTAPVVSELEILKSPDRVSLLGIVATQAQADELIDASAAAFGSDNIVSELVVNEAAGDLDWISKAKEMLPVMAQMSSAQTSLSDRYSQFSGVAETSRQKAQLVNSAKRVLGDQMVSEIDVIPSTKPVLAGDDESLESSPLAADETDGVLTTKQAKYVVSEGDSSPSGEVDSQLTSCQAQLDQAIAGKKILFAFNQAIIEKPSYPILDEIASVAASCGEVFAQYGLMVAGHTDNIGKQSYNQTLSQQRAEAVAEYLVKAGIDASQIASKGFGELKPLASNDSSLGRSQNRRIEFTINKTQE